MPPRLSRPFSFIPPIDDDDPPIDPRASFFFFFDPSESQYEDDLRRHSLRSIDSGYFSTMGKESPDFSRKPSAGDLRFPLAPINSIDPNRESPKREHGVIRNLLRKKKKSFPSDLDPDLGLPHRNPADDIPRSSSVPPRSNARDPSIDAFEEQDRFVIRRGMRHHPYSRDDASYMLAYDTTLLDNDKFSEILLQRLNPTQSPSFHDFSQPPRAILDLGCGPGTWAAEAAAFWPLSQVIGFDLLDPARLRSGTASRSNLQWKRGNFVKYKLPFPKNMFDLVRMANLSLCVPHDRWEHVMSEVRRVLAQGGRLELIDDYLYFPYTKHPPQPSEDSVSTPRPSSSSFYDDDDDTEEDPDVEPENKDNDDEDDFVSTKSRFSTLVDTDDFPPLPPYDPISEWNRNINNSKCLEKLFEDMLSRKFSVHPRPSKLFDNVIDKVFGRYNQCRLHEFNLYLAPPPSQDSDDSSGSESNGSSDGHGSASLKKAGKDFARWVTSVEWEHYNKEKEKKQPTKGDRSSDDSLGSLSTVPGTISPKAAGRLGIKPTGREASHALSTQSPGLILWPATLIPIAPFELEMHACKHLHSLIGCKAALTEHLHDIAQEQNLPFDQEMVDDLIWDYESFRRKRFNWPSGCLDSHSNPFSTTPRLNSIEPLPQSRPRTGSGSMNPPPDPLYPREKLDFVRSIKVYSATKNDEEIHVQ